MADIQDIVAACTEFRTCGCALGVTKGKPALARVRNKETDKGCIGVLINDLYILANAECRNMTNRTDVELTVTLKKERVAVDSVILPPDHFPDMIPRQNNIMLLRLRAPLNMSLHVPICLPEASLFVHLGAKALIMSPGHLRIGVKIQGRKCCYRRRTMGLVRSILLREGLFLCAGEVTTPFCNHEPGNLLVMKRHGWFTLLGLSTTQEFFTMCGNSMGLFSEVLPLREWIRNNTQDASQCQFV